LLTIALAGNPNCGKSALFNTLTGVRQKTGNWPGVTVERKEGVFDLLGRQTAVVDLPGIYSLDASSIDEQVTRDYLLSGQAQLIVNIIDASNLERNLYFSVQLLEMGVPIVVALNMMDVARRRGIELDLETLSEKLGCPVVPVVAVSGEGIPQLKQQIQRVVDGERGGGFQMTHEDTLEQAVTDLGHSLARLSSPLNTRWLALKLLEGDPAAIALTGEVLRPQVEHWRKMIEDRVGEEVDMHIADARYGHAHVLAQQVVRQQGRLGRTLSDRIDKLVLNRVFGIPVFLAVMYLMFMFTINIGGAFIDFFDGVAGAIFVDALGGWMRSLGTPEWLVMPLADGVGGGIQVVATFIPIITCLYLFLSILEDSGYMARAAFVMDRFMRTIGLPGKAFVPMIVGFGCNVPAVMATRTLENPRERRLTILMNPFMSCGARLPVYALFAAAFFPTNGQNLVFGLYLIGILVAVMTGLIMKRTLLAGASTGFVMELPPYHMPTARGVSLRTWDRLKMFISEAGRVIIVMVLALNLLNSLGTDGSFGNQNSEKSVLSTIGKAVTPMFAPLGIRQDNWPATVGIFTGVLAKEVVVGTLDSLYTSMALEESGAQRQPQDFDLMRAFGRAAATIPANLGKVADRIVDPFGMNLGNISSSEAAAAEQQVSAGVFGTMVAKFDGGVGAFAYLLFILLYFPCVATLGAIVRETGGAWAAFVAAWTSGTAFTFSTLYYQIGTYSQHPTSSAAWILGLLGFACLSILALRLWGQRTPDGRAAHPREVQV
jgi:ferrous iron transport protein B